MRNYIRDNGKKIMAVLTVLLMVTWVISPGRSGNSWLNGQQRLVGYAGDTKVYDSDISRAKSEWDFLENVIMQSPQGAQGQWMPLAYVRSRMDPSFQALSEQL